MKFGITVHSLVCNEENWAWFALMSVKDLVDKIIVYDTGSTDRTVEIIRSITDPKIEFVEKGSVSASQLIQFRQEQINKTQTPWILLLDGDEVWDKNSLSGLIKEIESVDESIWGIVTRTRNCVGDIYHVMPEYYGQYRIGDKKGHLNLRAIRDIKGLEVRGTYPNEAFYPGNAEPLQNQPEHLQMSELTYWHMTHLHRSSKLPSVRGQRKQVFDLGVSIPKGVNFPEVFSLNYPSFLPSPQKSRSWDFIASALLTTPLRYLKHELRGL